GWHDGYVSAVFFSLKDYRIAHREWPLTLIIAANTASDLRALHGAPLAGVNGVSRDECAFQFLQREHATDADVPMAQHSKGAPAILAHVLEWHRRPPRPSWQASDPTNGPAERRSTLAAA